ncbi:MAG: peptidyl-prolyl cis-trans isomerase [Acidobacteriaceae bacterium]
MKKTAVHLLLIASVFALTLPLSADSVVEEIIARVNSQIISRSELQTSREQVHQELEKDKAPASDIAKKEKDTLRDLIDQQLLIQKADDLGVTADAEVIKRLDQMRKDMGLDSMEALEKAATAQGVNFEDYKLQMKNRILTERVISDEVGRHVAITPAEIEQFYNRHKQEFDQPEQVALSEILISTAKSAKNPSEDESQRALQAEAKAKAVYDKLKAGAKWEDLAKADSSGETAAQGGQLGGYKRGQLAPEIESKVFGLKPGQFTEPIHTKQGFLLLKVDQHVAAGVPPLKDVQTEVQNAIYSQKMEPALREYLTKLREDAYIEVRPGYVDTGASPNQTKPTYTNAAADPNAKKLGKKKKKLGIF